MSESITRRAMLRRSSAITLAALGALACSRRSPEPGASDALSIASWPMYIDIDEKTSKRPSLEQFQRETGVKVRYREVIKDSEAFLGTIRPALAEAKPTGWDLAILADTTVSKMIRSKYVATLDHSKLPNFARHAGRIAKDAPYDPGNSHSVPWQAQITGIAYNRKLAGREITSFSDLLDPAFKGKVGMMSEMRDTMDLTLVGLGVAPAAATEADVRRAHATLKKQRDAGIVRDYYRSNYTRALTRGDLAVAMAWSGDAAQLHTDNPDLQFVVPKEGGLIGVDCLVIPKGAAHIAEAHQFIDFVYRPEVAAQIADAMGYVTPVPGTQAVLRTKGSKTADDARVFPSSDVASKLLPRRNTSAAEDKLWSELFEDVLQS